MTRIVNVKNFDLIFVFMNSEVPAGNFIIWLLV